MKSFVRHLDCVQRAWEEVLQTLIAPDLINASLLQGTPLQQKFECACYNDSAAMAGWRSFKEEFKTTSLNPKRKLESWLIRLIEHLQGNTKSFCHSP